MGVSTVLASTIIVYILLVVGGFLAGLTVYSLTQTIESQDKLFSTMTQETIEYSSMSYGTVNGTSYVKLNLTNTGSTNIYDYQSTDVIVYYTSTGGAEEIFLAPYMGLAPPGVSPSSLSPGWYIGGLYDLTGTPKNLSTTGTPLWKPNLTLEILIVLPSQPANGTTLSVTIATSRGGYEYVEFTWG